MSTEARVEQSTLRSRAHLRIGPAVGFIAIAQRRHESPARPDWKGRQAETHLEQERQQEGRRADARGTGSCPPRWRGKVGRNQEQPQVEDRMFGAQRMARRAQGWRSRDRSERPANLRSRRDRRQKPKIRPRQADADQRET